MENCNVMALDVAKRLGTIGKQDRNIGLMIQSIQRM